MTDFRAIGKKNKRKGHDKERKILSRYAREWGYSNKSEANKSGDVILLRSAGSHSPIDCVIIDWQGKSIKLIQSKSSEAEAAKEREKWGKKLKGVFDIEYLAE